MLPELSYTRYKTRVVNIGDVPLGGNYPIRIQSMTTTDTMDTIATVEQSIRIIESGADYVRITAPSINEAKNLEQIKKELRLRGYNTPLIADIHFTPNAAELAAKIVEKVRINPGNYVDKKKFNIIEYSDSDYNAELERIREKFSPLVKICKEYGTAMRIGTNHGSLSDRIMSRFGDTPFGMVESALEFLRICEDLDYHEIVLSMKSSNPRVMVQAYRLLVNKMEAEGMNYPLHLGVTEAGDGEDGRIKSATGIGTLLEDGYGDTIRVSLTEEPEFEIPVCKSIVKRYSSKPYNDERKASNLSLFTPYEYSKRESFNVDNIGGNNVPVVIVSLDCLDYESLKTIGYYYSETLDKWNISDFAPDFIFIEKVNDKLKLPGTLKKVLNYSEWKKLEDKSGCIPLLSQPDYLSLQTISNPVQSRLKFVLLNYHSLSSEFLSAIKSDSSAVIIIDADESDSLLTIRRSFLTLIKEGVKNPAIIRKHFAAVGIEEFTNYASIDVGGSLLDGFSDGIWLESADIPLNKVNSISFGILQATRTRISKTEYISCPSCGRTLFDLQETTARVREKTNHLKGVKIAIMGCIVNGPGEMADADYGYVGSGPGKITLYKGKEVIKRSINSDIAVNELVELIKSGGDWSDPS